MTFTSNKKIDLKVWVIPPHGELFKLWKLRMPFTITQLLNIDFQGILNWMLTILCYGKRFTRIKWFQQLIFCIKCEMYMQTILNPHYSTHMIIIVMVIMIAFEYEIKLENNLISSLQIVLIVALLFLCANLLLTP